MDTQLKETICTALANHQFKKAEQLAQELLAKNSTDAESLYLLGLAEARQGNFVEAIQHLKLATEFAPNNAQYLGTTANVYKLLGQLQTAECYFKQALELTPTDAVLHNNYATLLEKLARTQDALQHYALAVQYHPTYITAHYNLGLLFLKQQQLLAAQKQFTNVVTLEPGHWSAHYQLATLYYQQQNWPSATDHYQNVLVHQPEDVESLNNLGVIALKQNQPQLAVDYFSRVLAIDQNHLTARSNLAATFLEHNRFANAVTHYRELLQHTPKNIEAHFNLGVALMGLNQLGDAINCFNAVITEEPNYADAYANLGIIARDQGQQHDAAAWFEKTLHLQPNNQTIRYLHSALTCHTSDITRAPTAFVSTLFDNYAGYFEQHLAKRLDYQLPELFYDRLKQWCQPNASQWQILDLGCGTGLCGQKVKEWSKWLVGVDLSSKMIFEAVRKQIYDALVIGDLSTLLARAQHTWDLIMAADVLVYLGELSELFGWVKQALKPNGYFLFSTEICAESKLAYQLQQTGRFAHTHDYLNALIKQHDLQLVFDEIITARLQQDKPLQEQLLLVQNNSPETNLSPR